MPRVIPVLILLAALGGLRAAAQNGVNTRPTEPSHSGYPAYSRYCAACHGVEGRGDGPVANVLRPRPPNLRQLHRKFPLPFDARLREFIDGRNMPRAHGESDMPVWGARLHREVSPSLRRELATLGTLTLILDYLETIQGAPEPT